MRKLSLLFVLFAACVFQYTVVAQENLAPQDGPHASLKFSSKAQEMFINFAMVDPTETPWADLNGNGTFDAGEAIVKANPNAEGVNLHFAIRRIDVNIYGNFKLLDIDGDDLSGVDLSKEPNLVELICSANKIKSLDLSKNPKLESVICNNNGLKTLIINNHAKLNYLKCYNNKMTSLDVSGCPALNKIYCYNNRIEGAEMDKFISTLTNQDSRGTIVVIDTKDKGEANICTVAQVKKIVDLNFLVYDNHGGKAEDYEGGDTPHGPKVTPSDINGSQIVISRENATNKILNLYLEGEGLGTWIDLNGNKQCEENEMLELGKTLSYTLDINKVTIYGTITFLQCTATGVSALDVTKAPELKGIDCSSNRITSLDLSKNRALQNISCENNQITKLDLTNNQALKHIGCQWNKIDAITLTKAPNLIILDINNNYIKDPAMKALFEKLPECSDENQGVITVIDTKSKEKDNNECGVKTVEIATDKNWKVYDLNSTGIPTEYEGSKNVSTQEITEQATRVFPTRTTDVISIVGISGNLFGSKARIFNAIGEEVMQIAIDADSQQVDVRSLEPGYYILKIGNSAYRFIKE